MSGKIRIRNFALYSAGLVIAIVATIMSMSTQSISADQYACIRQGLVARGMSGNIPQSKFTITYSIPGCYSDAGYHIEYASMRGGEVAVTYSK